MDGPPEDFDSPCWPSHDCHCVGPPSARCISCSMVSRYFFSKAAELLFGECLSIIGIMWELNDMPSLTSTALINLC